MKAILLEVFLLPLICFSQPINADIIVKFELLKPARFLYIVNEPNNTVDTISFPANNEWVYKGLLLDAGEISLITSDTTFIRFWADEIPISFSCKEKYNQRGRKEFVSENFIGSDDARLYDMRPILTNWHYTRTITGRMPDPSETASFHKNFYLTKSTGLIDSLFKTNPESPVLPYYINYLRNNLDLENIAMYYDQLPGKVQLGYYGQKIKQHLDRSALLKKGITVENFVMNTDIDQVFNLYSVKAKVIVLDFWASWCGPCRAENPTLVKLYQSYKEKGLEIIGVSLDKEKEAWKKAIAKDKLTWIHVSDLKVREGELVRQYKIGGIPYMVLLNDRYEVIANDFHPRDLEALLKLHL